MPSGQLTKKQNAVGENGLGKGKKPEAVQFRWAVMSGAGASCVPGIEEILCQGLKLSRTYTYTYAYKSSSSLKSSIL